MVSGGGQSGAVVCIFDWPFTTRRSITPRFYITHAASTAWSGQQRRKKEKNRVSVWCEVKKNKSLFFATLASFPNAVAAVAVALFAVA